MGEGEGSRDCVKNHESGFSLTCNGGEKAVLRRMHCSWGATERQIRLHSLCAGASQTHEVTKYALDEGINPELLPFASEILFPALKFSANHCSTPGYSSNPRCRCCPKGTRRHGRCSRLAAIFIFRLFVQAGQVRGGPKRKGRSSPTRAAKTTRMRLAVVPCV